MTFAQALRKRLERAPAAEPMETRRPRAARPEPVRAAGAAPARAGAPARGQAVGRGAARPAATPRTAEERRRGARRPVRSPARETRCDVELVLNWSRQSDIIHRTTHARPDTADLSEWSQRLTSPLHHQRVRHSCRLRRVFSSSRLA